MLKVCCIVVYSIMETRDAISNPVSSMNQDVLKACHGYGKLTATNPFQGTMLWNNREVTRTGNWQKILGGQYINIFWFHPPFH